MDSQKERDEKRGVFKIKRDPKTGLIIEWTVPTQMSEKMMMGMLTATADALSISLNRFSKTSNRYSIVLSVLTGVLVVLAIAQIVLIVLQVIN